MQDLAASPIRGLRHDGQGDTLLPEQSLIAGDEFEIRAAMGLEIDDHRAGPFAVHVRQDGSEERFAGLNRVEMLYLRGTMSPQHASQQVGGMSVIINQRDEWRVVGYTEHGQPHPRAARGSNRTKRQHCPRAETARAEWFIRFVEHARRGLTTRETCRVRDIDVTAYD